MVNVGFPSRVGQRFNIGLDAWIIQDGNYPDFEVGSEYRFALEFCARELRASRPGAKSLTLIDGADYVFSGECLRSDGRLTVLDVGLKCYCDVELRPHPAPGHRLAGSIYLGVDPFVWFERYAQREDLPDLFYAWRVHEILQNTVPQEGTAQAPPRQRGTEISTFRSIPSANAREDDDGRAEYVLAWVR